MFCVCVCVTLVGFYVFYVFVLPVRSAVALFSERFCIMYFTCLCLCFCLFAGHCDFVQREVCLNVFFVLLCIIVYVCLQIVLLESLRYGSNTAWLRQEKEKRNTNFKRING